MPRLSLLPAAVWFASGEEDVWGRTGGIAADSSRRVFTFMQGSNNAAKVRGSFQETAPVVANHSSGGVSLVVVTTLLVCALSNGTIFSDLE